ncbi:GNAT family N-acetyltransferase [Marivivens donghaensis]|uniref:GNAT family N-acetyltransferase n=1 Tax=Marivivens donghaensis TaxID=1699413 RepID=UPI00201F872E|nr:GNAT family N-acetyltransferase [Marivivens donghaensis]MCL7409766.1 GNAT family N-acetyltransferase [Marivivens donghaensis]MDN3705201.1 GNAT family N-acetyltransferase [Marivivens donghaensis]
MTLTYQVLDGDAVAAALDDLARLRIDVFADWPYLYAGSLDYERDYVATYRDAQNAILVAAKDGDRIVGAATGTPMEDHASDFAAPFAATGIPLTDIFYCAESVLLADYRGQGAGHVFFDMREAKAKALGRRYVAFCSVMRPEDHPARPADYRPLDGFWGKRGYEKLDGVVARFKWTDHGDVEQSEKPLQFWIKAL